MKHLFLTTSTPFEVIDEAIDKLNEQLESKNQTTIRSRFLFGRSAYPYDMQNIQVFLFLGVDALRANQDLINPEAIVFLYADPMNLSCIVKEDNITRLDFVQKEEGFGFFLQKRTSHEIAEIILKEMNRKLSGDSSKDVVRVEVTDAIPQILNAVNDTTSFISEFQRLKYAIRNIIDREKFQKTFIEWIVSDEKTKSLRNRLIISSKMKKSKAIDALVEVFKTSAGKEVREALRSMIRTIKDDRKPKFDRLSDKYKVSPYDLRYIANLYTKSNLLLEDVDSNIAHITNTNFRYEEQE